MRRKETDTILIQQECLAEQKERQNKSDSNRFVSKQRDNVTEGVLQAAIEQLPQGLYCCCDSL